MPDEIANFPLRNATSQELGIALGRSYRDYLLWHGQATIIANFVQDARTAGVKAVVADRNRISLDLAQEEGILKGTPITNALLDAITDHHLATADYGGRIAAIVMLHNASERFLWRIVRFGLVANRTKAVEWVADRKVSVKSLQEQPPEVLTDNHLEQWWEDLEREGFVKKWDRLIGLVSYPAKLTTGTWHFDRDMLAHFDQLRHSAVHHDGQAVRKFDFSEFAKQLERAQLIWTVHIARMLKLQIPAETLFSAG
ncbi:MAG: hypothetical protein L0241_14225 [Planctomycetia bacterium]|nr:hypothetical protein [Planctomycetia bacterium]